MEIGRPVCVNVGVGPIFRTERIGDVRKRPIAGNEDIVHRNGMGAIIISRGDRLTHTNGSMARSSAALRLWASSPMTEPSSD